MAEAGEQIDQYWEEVMVLTERLTAVAGRLFKDRGCSDVEAILPGTGMCAIDLVEKTITDSIRLGHWVPGSGGNHPFPMAYKALKRDFLDVIKGGAYRTTEITESIEGEYADNIRASSTSDKTEGALLVNSVQRHLKNDKQAIEFLQVLLVKGFETEADIGREMGISEQEVGNIKRRLRSKIRIWARMGLTDRQ